MADRARAAALVESLGDLLGLAGLSLDANGYCCLSFDASVVNLEHDEAGGQLLLYSYLGEPKGDRLKAYEALLDANFFWKATDGATLSLERETGGIVLLDRLALEGVEIAGFQAVLERFIAAVERWRGHLAEWRDETPRPIAAEIPFGIGLRV